MGEVKEKEPTMWKVTKRLHNQYVFLGNKFRRFFRGRGEKRCPDITELVCVDLPKIIPPHFHLITSNFCHSGWKARNSRIGSGADAFPKVPKYLLFFRAEKRLRQAQSSGGMVLTHSVML